MSELTPEDRARLCDAAPQRMDAYVKRWLEYPAVKASMHRNDKRHHPRMIYQDEKIAELVAENAKLRALLIEAGAATSFMPDEWKQRAQAVLSADAR